MYLFLHISDVHLHRFFFFGVPLSFFFCLFVFVSSSYCYFSATHIILSSIELFSSLFFRFSSSSAAHRIHIFPTPCFYLFWFAFAFFFLRFIFFKLSFYAAISKPESKWATAAKLFYTAILLRKSLRLFLSLFFLSFCVTFFFFKVTSPVRHEEEWSQHTSVWCSLVVAVAATT